MNETPRGSDFPPIQGQENANTGKAKGLLQFDPVVDNQQNHMLITKNLVNASLQAQSRYGPTIHENSDPEVIKEVKESSGSIDYENVKVLVVDDNFFCSMSVSTQLN